ncbi:MAG: restriction endonuclease subunit S [Bacteroidetes bacterium]|nr:restriction endonuclease subunit S [Bacteroidota bacterium]
MIDTLVKPSRINRDFNLPEDWTLFNIPELTNRKDGIKTGPFGSQLKRELLVKKGIKVYGQENVFQQNFDIGDRYINETHFKRLKSCELIPGDFLISMMGTIGRTSIVPDIGIKAIMDSHLLRLRLNESVINPAYLLHFFSSKGLMDQVTKLTVGGIMDGLSSTIVKKLHIPLPPTIKEQTTIAEALSEADALILGFEKLIAKKQSIKQGVMQELLRRKEGWEMLNLGTSSTLKARIGWQGLTTAEYLNQGQYYLITGTEIIDGKVKWEACHYVEKNRYSQDKNIQLKPNDILVTKDGTIGKTAIVHELPKPATLNSGVFVIRPKKSDYFPGYLFYILRSIHFENFLNKLSAGSTISHLYQKDFVHFDFPVPNSLGEQIEISILLSNLDAEISKLGAKLDKYKMIKQGMMQNLLTGKIRLI